MQTLGLVQTLKPVTCALGDLFCVLEIFTMSIHHPEIVVTSRIPPFLTTGLQENYVLHERDHIRDRQVFGRVRALVGGGESKIDAAYMALFPALEMISSEAISVAEVAAATINSSGDGQKKDNTWIWVVVGLAVIGGGIYLLHRHIKKEEEKENRR